MAQAPREFAENELKLSLSMGEENARKCEEFMDVLCKWIWYVSGCLM